MLHSEATTTSDGAWEGLRWIRWLVRVNLALVALQAWSAGFLLSGSGAAVMIHARVALALVAGSLSQAVAAVVLWRQSRVPVWVARAGIVLFVMVVLQVGLGHSKRFWLHVPLGVGLFGGLVRQTSRVDTWHANGTRL